MDDVASIFESSTLDPGTFTLSQTLTGKGLYSSTFQLKPSRFGHILVSPCLIDWGRTMLQTYPTKCAYFKPKSERV